MKQGLTVLGIAALAVLGACGQKQEASDPTEAEDAVFDPMIEAVERARQVEQTHSNRVQELNRALEAVEGKDAQQADDDDR